MNLVVWLIKILKDMAMLFTVIFMCDRFGQDSWVFLHMSPSVDAVYFGVGA